ncbi:hypothetical protein GPL15_00020 [Clostridium sp. MCC353]|uniref:hypothetical protein n=1 Tax=Clostridium sp. MCC353 TaxID=2592646 RepID=UPI001C00FB80|nr:hypothetical protein [Clostridium sp. MCC353]MBT9774902.1 hypothetical protein [Clostridium sp. MCC353]
MFGFSKEATAENLEKLVQGKKWDKIKKNYLNAAPETRVNLAKACATVSSDDSINILTLLLDAPEESVKIAALQALTKVGNDHCVSLIQHMSSSVSPDQTVLRAEIQNALNALRGRQ